MNNQSFSRIRNWLQSNFYRPHSQPSLISGLFSLLLVGCLLISGCSSLRSQTMLSGDYQYDTQYVINNLGKVIDQSPEEFTQIMSAEDADGLISEYISRYRRDPELANTGSFRALDSALNGLAGFYHSYPGRPLSDDLKDRLHQQFKQANTALKREFD